MGPCARVASAEPVGRPAALEGPVTRIGFGVGGRQRGWRLCATTCNAAGPAHPSASTAFLHTALPVHMAVG
jgi:hypothetical protein